MLKIFVPGFRLTGLILGIFLCVEAEAQQLSDSGASIEAALVRIDHAREHEQWAEFHEEFLGLMKLAVTSEEKRTLKSNGILNILNALKNSKECQAEFDYIFYCFKHFPLDIAETDFLSRVLKMGLEDVAQCQSMEDEVRLYYSLCMPFEYAKWRKLNGFYQEAIDTMERVKNRLFNLKEEEKWEDHSKGLLLHSYNILGGIYADLGMFPLAISYNDLYLELIKNDSNPWGMALALGRKGDYLLSMGDTVQSLAILEETVRICAAEYPKILAVQARLKNQYSPEYIMYTSRLKMACRDLASVYIKCGKLQQADEMLQKVEAIPLLHHEDALYQAIYRAEFMEQKKDMRGAVRVLHNAVSSTLDSLHVKGQSVSPGNGLSLRIVMRSSLQLARLQQKAGLLREAAMTLDKLERELKKLTADLRVEWINLSIARLRLELDMYETSPDPVQLNGMLKKLAESQKMMLEYQAITTDEKSKLDLNKAGRELYGLGLALAAVMPDGSIQEELAVQHAEAGRAVLLDQALRFQRTEQFQDIPDTLKRELAHLNAMIQGYELNQSLGQLLSQKELSNLTTLREDKRRLALRLKKEFPSSYSHSMVRQLPGINDLRKELSGGTGILSLSLHDTVIYAHLITRKESVFHRIPVPANFRSGIHHFLQVLKSSRKATWDSPEGQLFTRLARRYYQMLFEPFEKQLPQRLLVVPDGPLAFIPFDCLLTADPPEHSGWHNLPYQIRKRALSVHFSIGSWLAEEQKILPDFSFPWVGFAPDFPIPIAFRPAEADSRDILIKLLYNTREVEGVGAVLKGKAFLNDEASLAAFRGIAGQSAILHLSTHAKANDRRGDHSFIAFSNSDAGDPSDPGDTLHAAEIYRLHIPAELLILSACETGVGEVKDGEGMIGLHHAFTHAGVKSILSTLWTVDDRSMADMMVLFASLLSEGHTKDIALQQAKLQFLGSQPKLAHPFYWSAPTIQGNLQPLYHAGHLWYWLGGILMVCGLFFGYRYQRSRRV